MHVCLYTFRDREREKQNGLVCIIVSSNIPGSSPTLLNPTSLQRIGMKTSSPGPQTTEILRRVSKTTPHAKFNMLETKSGKTCCFSMSMFVSAGLCSQLSLITYLICWLSHHCWWPLSVSCFKCHPNTKVLRWSPFWVDQLQLSGSTAKESTSGRCFQHPRVISLESASSTHVPRQHPASAMSGWGYPVPGKWNHQGPAR